MRLAVDLAGLRLTSNDVDGPVRLESSGDAYPAFGGFDWVARVVYEVVVTTRALEYAKVGERQRPRFYDTSDAVYLEKPAADQIRAVTPDWSETMPIATWQLELHATAAALLSYCAERSWTTPTCPSWPRTCRVDRQSASASSAERDRLLAGSALRVAVARRPRLRRRVVRQRGVGLPLGLRTPGTG